jgi:hypothetical protein
MRKTYQKTYHFKITTTRGYIAIFIKNNPCDIFTLEQVINTLPNPEVHKGNPITFENFLENLEAALNKNNLIYTSFNDSCYELFGKNRAADIFERMIGYWRLTDGKNATKNCLFKINKRNHPAMKILFFLQSYNQSNPIEIASAIYIPSIECTIPISYRKKRNSKKLEVLPALSQMISEVNFDCPTIIKEIDKLNVTLSSDEAKKHLLNMAERNILAASKIFSVLKEFKDEQEGTVLKLIAILQKKIGKHEVSLNQHFRVAKLLSGYFQMLEINN